MRIVPVSFRLAQAYPVVGEDIVRRMNVNKRQWPRINSPLTPKEFLMANLLSELVDRGSPEFARSPGNMPSMKEIFTVFKDLSVRSNPEAQKWTLQSKRKDILTTLYQLLKKGVLKDVRDDLEKSEKPLAGDPLDFSLSPGAFIDPWTILLLLNIPDEKLKEISESVLKSPNPNSAKRIKNIVNKGV